MNVGEREKKRFKVSDGSLLDGLAFISPDLPYIRIHYILALPSKQ